MLLFIGNLRERPILSHIFSHSLSISFTQTTCKTLFILSANRQLLSNRCSCLKRAVLYRLHYKWLCQIILKYSILANFPFTKLYRFYTYNDTIICSWQITPAPNIKYLISSGSHTLFLKRAAQKLSFWYLLSGNCEMWCNSLPIFKKINFIYFTSKGHGSAPL